MRICLYTETALPRIGGQELVVDALARHFSAFGHEVVVVAPRPRHTPPPDDSGLPYPVVRHRPFISSRTFLDWYCWPLARLYWKRPYDVLHCHNVYPGGYVCTRWAALSRVPLVITSHNADIGPGSPLLDKRGVPERMAQVLHRAAAVVAVSPYMERRLRGLCPAGCRVAQIPNGVDFARYANRVPRPAVLPPQIRSGNYFLSLGRLVHQKGGDLLLDAFAAAGRGNDSCLVIAGTGSAEPSLRAQANDLGLSERVHFAGRVEGETKTYLLQNALAAVMPSRSTEGFPLTVLESYACGVPVIGSRVPGLDDVVWPGRTGALVSPESPGEIAQAMSALIAESWLARQWGEEARRVAQDYDWSRVAARHITLFETLIAARARPRTVSAASWFL